MLHVTDAAVTVFKEILDREDVTGSAIRRAAVEQPTGGSEIALQAVDGPREDDAPTEADGVDVFVDANLAVPLDTAVLDTEDTETGPKLVVLARPSE
jgi:Fe-S cluster assembly iron-binding protein IscA